MKNIHIPLDRHRIHYISNNFFKFTMEKLTIKQELLAAITGEITVSLEEV